VRKAQRAEQVAAVWWDTENDWILSTDVGTHWNTHNARKRFKLIADGHPAKSRSSTRITEDVYSHVTARLAEESAAALDRAL
jgi:hypothetical protein